MFLSYFLQDWTSYEEFSDITESNVFLAQEQPEAQPSTVGVALHPDAVHEPRATGTDEGDVSLILIPFLSYYIFFILSYSNHRDPAEACSANECCQHPVVVWEIDAQIGGS